MGTTLDPTAIARPRRHPDPHAPAVTGLPLLLLRVEGLAAFIAGIVLYGLATDGAWLLLIPLLLAVDVSALGYLAGPRAGAIGYDLAHTWATGLAVIGVGVWLASAPLLALAAILVAHTGMDRAVGYGLKYPTSFGDTHLGRIGRRA